MKSFLAHIIALFIAFAFFFSACTKIDETDLGQGLIPAVDNIHTFETTLNVITTTWDLNDSSRLTSSDDHFFGKIDGDPVFGNTEAITYFEVKPTFFGNKYKPFLDTIIGFDSAILSIRIKAYYGDTNTAQSLKLELIDDPGLPRGKTPGFYDSSFLVSNSWPVKPDYVADPINLAPTSLKDSIQYRFNNNLIKTNNTIRFKINPTLAAYLFNQDTANYVSDSAFRVLFKGFSIRSQTPGGKGFFYIDFTNANTALQFYYRRKSGNFTDTIATSYPFTRTLCAHAVYCKWDKAGSQYGSYTPSTGVSGDSIVYLKSQPGTYAKVQIPYIQSLSNRLVHRAELVVQELGGTPRYNPNILQPAKLQLEAIDTLSLNKFIFIPRDFNFSITGDPNIFYFGGFRVFSGVDNLGQDKHKYVFNLTGYTQGIISRQERNYDLRLYIPFKVFTTFYNPLGAENIVVGGGNHSVQPMKFRIIYSRL